MASGVPKKKLSVQFRDVHFHSQLPTIDGRLLNFEVNINRGNGMFGVRVQ